MSDTIQFKAAPKPGTDAHGRLTLGDEVLQAFGTCTTAEFDWRADAAVAVPPDDKTDVTDYANHFDDRVFDDEDVADADSTRIVTADTTRIVSADTTRVVGDDTTQIVKEVPTPAAELAAAPEPVELTAAVAPSPSVSQTAVVTPSVTQTAVVAPARLNDPSELPSVPPTMPGALHRKPAEHPDAVAIDDSPAIAIEPVVRQRSETRQTDRYRIAGAVCVVPVTLSGGPGRLYWCDGISVDASAGGLCVKIDSPSMVSSRFVIAGLEQPGGRRFATLEIRHQKRVGEALMLGGNWVSPTDDPLSEDRLMPTVDPGLMRFRYGLPTAALDAWQKLGVVRSFVLDRVLLCPGCQTLPSMRHGCHRCGSGRITQDRLVHHFACAHVDAAVRFETTHGLQCPKCRTKRMIVGSDFEFIDGPLQCHDCGGSGGQPTLSLMCHRCHQRFPADAADEQILTGYAVDRLDVESCFGALAIER